MLTVWRDLNEALRTIDFLNRHNGPLRYEWTVSESRGRPREAWPAVSFSETKEGYVYRAEVPGLAEDDVTIQVEDDVLFLRGERKSEAPQGYEVQVRERAPVAFSHKLPLPGRVDAEAVTATMKDGVLTVTLPRAKSSLPRQITVKAA
jgi:HSP20 family protein